MSDWGKYLVASEELEPGCGWDYTNWLSGLPRGRYFINNRIVSIGL